MEPDNTVHGLYQRLDRVTHMVRWLSSTVGGDIPSPKLSAQQIEDLIRALPVISEKQLLELGERDNFCPICFVPYLTILTEEEMAHAMDSPAHPVEELGVTKLSQSWQCNHMFCRRDISKWIADGHDSCPMCRRLLVEEKAPEPVAERAAGDLAETTTETSQETTQEPRFSQTSAVNMDFLRNAMDNIANVSVESFADNQEDGGQPVDAASEAAFARVTAFIETLERHLPPILRLATATEDGQPEDRQPEEYSGMFS